MTRLRALHRHGCTYRAKQPIGSRAYERLRLCCEQTAYIRYTRGARGLTLSHGPDVIVECPPSAVAREIAVTEVDPGTYPACLKALWEPEAAAEI